MSQQARNFSQDMPPPGGFGNVKIDYRAQKKGFSNLTFLALTTGVITFGLARYIYYQKQEKSEHSTAPAAHTSQHRLRLEKSITGLQSVSSTSALCCVVLCCSALRLARVEERTEYAHKLDDYFRQKSATLTHMTHMCTASSSPCAILALHRLTSPHLTSPHPVLLCWCVQGCGEEAAVGGCAARGSGEEESKARSTAVTETQHGAREKSSRTQERLDVECKYL